MDEKEMTAAETARRLGVSLTYVYSLLWAGKLVARKVSKQWRIAATSVEARLKQRGA